jgi:MATE family multidrug resistance protein
LGKYFSGELFLNPLTQRWQGPGGYRNVLQVGLPLVFSMISMTIMQFTDRIFLGNYSLDAIAASMPAGIASFLFFSFFMGVVEYVSVFVAQYTGAKAPWRVGAAVWQGLYFCFMAAFILASLGFAAEWIFSLAGHSAPVQELEIVYFRILCAGGGFALIATCFSTFYSGRGLTWPVAVINGIGALVNIPLDYALINGKWGLPEMGIAGAGWATVIGSWVSPLIFAVLYFSKPVAAEFGTLRHLRFDRDLFMRMIRFGLPSGIHWFLDVAAFTLFVLLVGRMGPIAHIASNIALSINLIAFMPMIGMGMAASILVGQYLGRSQPEYAERVGWLALKIGVGYIAFIGTTFLLFPAFYTNVFEGDAIGTVPFSELLKAVRILLVMLAIWGIADATAIILSGALKGAGDTHFVMYFQSVVAWGFLVAGQLVLVFVFKCNVYVSWAWTLLYIIILGAGFTLRFRSNRWKKIDLLDRRASVVDDGQSLGSRHEA